MSNNEERSGLFDSLLDTEGAELPLALLVVVLGYWVYKNYFAGGAEEDPVLPPPNPRARTVEKTTNEGSNSKRGDASASDGVPLKIFFGSQTGTAEDFAATLAREAKKLKFQPTVIDMEDYDPEDLAEEKEGAVLFVVATYGEGEPTDNAVDFHSWLVDESRSDSELEDVKFAVFGLGNKTYEHNYNAMGRRVNTKLEALGATRFAPYGEGDDDLTLEEDFGAWKKTFWKAACEHFKLEPPGITDVDEVVDSWTLEMHDAGSDAANRAVERGSFHIQMDEAPKNRQTGPVELKNPALGTIKIKRELHGKSSDRSCTHAEIEVDGRVKYQPGDHVGLFPDNDPELVERLAARLGVNLDQAFTAYQATANGRRKVMSCTVRQALSQWMDIAGCPRRSALRALMNHTKDDAQKNKLARLIDLESPQPYQGYVVDSMRTLLCVLEDLPSCTPPLGCVLEHFPRLTPRYYSISSSQAVHQDTVHVTCVLTDFVTPAKRHHKGVASTWLHNARVGDKVPVYIRTSKFRLPKQDNVPIVMVGPGTGLAPFRGFLQELRHRRGTASADGSAVALFFGCRHPDQDYLYEDELLDYARSGTLTHLHNAISRPTDGSRKQYVQDVMVQKDVAPLLAQWLGPQGGGYFYVCGDAKHMEKDVHKAIAKILEEHCSMTEDAAEQYLKKMSADGKYQTDTWF